jgi:hypothetical protein
MKKILILGLVLVGFSTVTQTKEETPNWQTVIKDFSKAGTATAFSCVGPIVGVMALKESTHLGLQALGKDTDFIIALQAAGVIGATSFCGYAIWRLRQKLLVTMSKDERYHGEFVSDTALFFSSIIALPLLIKAVVELLPVEN